jgi:hypothetical protein
MIDAARAAPALFFNRQRVPNVPEAAAVNPADETHRRFSLIILANRMGFSNGPDDVKSPG